MPRHLDDPTRRGFLLAGAAAGLPIAFDGALAQGQLTPTPACGDDHGPTLRQTEGPFFKPRSPERLDLIDPGMRGQPMELSGFVLTRGCKPMPRALFDLWHADDAGDYDNQGFRLRGHQYADAEGRYRVRTIVPGAYTGRTRHFHVKVQAPGGRVLTTQLYFPDDAGNRRDGLFRPELLMRVAKVGGSLAARFDFVLDAA